jgi:DNA-binding MarR family transcriptional regulator
MACSLLQLHQTTNLVQLQQTAAKAFVMTAQPSDLAVGAWARLIRVQQSLLDKVEAELAAAGLPPLVWYDVLLELRRAGPEPLRHRDLHARMLLAKHNLSRLLDRMEAAELIERQPCKDDARGADIGLTAKGAATQKRMWPVYGRAIQAHFAEKLSEAELSSLARIFAKLK